MLNEIKNIWLSLQWDTKKIMMKLLKGETGAIGTTRAHDELNLAAGKENLGACWATEKVTCVTEIPENPPLLPNFAVFWNVSSRQKLASNLISKMSPTLQHATVASLVWQLLPLSLQADLLLIAIWQIYSE